MSKQIPHMFFVTIKKKLYSLIIMVAFLCIIAVPPSSTLAASNLEEGIKELAQQISNNMIKTGKKKIAVVEFSDLDGMITAFGQHLAEELITELFLASPGQFEVVERRQLMKVLSEQRLTMSGLLDAKAMESVGKILGIEAIVTGSMTDLESSIKINARMIGIETARVFAVARTSIPKIGIVAKLMAKEAIISQPNLQTIPKATANLSPSSVYTNKNSKIFHKYNCSELNAEGAIEFESAQRAIKAGGMACSRCNPSQQEQAGVKDEQGGTSSVPSFQNSFLRVTLQSISKSEDGMRVNIVLLLKNISNEDILLALQYSRSVSLLGNQGIEWLLDYANGIETITNYDDKKSYSVFNPGTENTITITFRSRGEESDETIFGFSANMYRFVNKSPTRFSIGI
ncbi:MAG: FlgO family outer membrane protein, partial [Candidatus Scalindua sp.]